ncbi:MAG: threonyl-tRNA synthetase editing domain-containing protein [Bacteroidales bacterium]|nr:threonyl-tRNA synthetase editing domain-containing protein [Bacteroidales bacterium]
MKLLMTYSNKISYKPTIKTLETASDDEKSASFENILVAFIHAEAQDEEDFKETEKKLVKNLKWGARKNNTKRILLHSFAHLASSKASPEFTKEIFDNAEERLKNTDFEVFQSPFGYFLDLNIDMPGYSQARIFTEFNRVKCDGEDS